MQLGRNILCITLYYAWNACCCITCIFQLVSKVLYLLACTLRTHILILHYITLLVHTEVY